MYQHGKTINFVSSVDLGEVLPFATNQGVISTCRWMATAALDGFRFSTKKPSDERHYVGGIQWMSGGVIAVFVLGALCMIVGAVYAYIYFTRINPRANRSVRKNPGTSPSDDVNQATSTHLFLFKKS
jgi:hypothetical protein